MAQYRLNEAIKQMGRIVKSGSIAGTGYASCIVLIGETGVGKSTAVSEWCEENGYGYKSIWLNGMEDNGDLLGRTYEEDMLDKEGNPTGEKITRFATPEFFPIPGKDPERGILVLEEINSIPVHLVEQLKGLISERRVGEYRLPDGWMLVGTSNPTSEDKNFSTTDYNTFQHDAAIRARLIELAVRTDLEDWIAYVYKTGNEVNPDLGSLLMSKAKSGDEANLFKAVGSPRQFSTLNSLLNSLGTERSGEVAMLCDGVIKSDEFTRAMISFLDTKGTRRPFSPSEIMENPKDCLKIYKEEAGNKNQPFLYYTWHNFSLFVKNAEKKEAKKRAWKLENKEIFDNYQKFARETPMDILLPGLMISMENVGYAMMLMEEDEEFFNEMKEHKDAILEVFNKHNSE